MTLVAVERRFEIDTGHRVLRHESLCAHPHGHRYAIVVRAEAPSGLDDLGRVIDFGVIKEILGQWLDAHWDHAFVVASEDSVLRDFLASQGFRHYVLDENPTAENMARHLLHDICPKIFEGTRVTITEVRIHETPNCTAVASR